MLQHLLIITWLFGATLTTMVAASDIVKYSPDSSQLRCFDFNMTNEISLENCSLGNVTSLQLSHNNISSVSLVNDSVLQIYITSQNHLSFNLDSMVNFQELDISHNLLTDIPYSLLVHQTWKKLDFSFNRIVNITKPLVTNCQSLHLQSNKIQQLSDGIFQDCPYLEELDLSDNNLQQINLKTFDNLKNLSTLNLSKNQIQTVDGSLSLSKLERLDLSQNSIPTISETTFSGAPLSLGELNLSHNKFTKIPSGVFTKLLSLKNISLQGNNMTKFINSLQLPYHLEKLDLSNCSLEKIDQCTFRILKDIQDFNLMHNSLLCNCDLLSIRNTFGSSVHIDTCRNSSKEGNKIKIKNLKLKCKFQICKDRNFLNVDSDSSSNLNVSAEVEKGRVRITWMTSLVVNRFYVSIKDSSQKQIEDVQLRYEHEYSFDSESAFSTYHICVDALNNDNDAISKKCIKVFIKDANMITGIVAGLIALIPCVFGLIYITCKDRHYDRIDGKIHSCAIPEVKVPLPESNDKKTPAKLAPVKEKHNKAFQPDDDKPTLNHQNLEKPPHTSIEIPANANNSQCTNL